MSLTCSLLPLIMKNIILFALAEHIYSTFAKNRVRQAGHRNAQCKGASLASSTISIGFPVANY